MIWHILPCNDLKDHKECSTCDCEPKAEVLENEDVLIIHNSFDQREILEQVEEILEQDKC